MVSLDRSCWDGILFLLVRARSLLNLSSVVTQNVRDI